MTNPPKNAVVSAQDELAAVAALRAAGVSKTLYGNYGKYQTDEGMSPPMRRGVIPIRTGVTPIRTAKEAYQSACSWHRFLAVQGGFGINADITKHWYGLARTRFAKAERYAIWNAAQALYDIGEPIATTRTVVVPSSGTHGGGQWNTVTLTLDWHCPVCGEARGVPYKTQSYDGRQRITVDGWRNPCGHVDTYEAVRREVQA